MSDRPLLADERPIPPGDEIKRLEKTPTWMKARRSDRFNSVKRARLNRKRTLALKLFRKDYTRLLRLVDSMPSVTIQQFCEKSILSVLNQKEKDNGGPFPPIRGSKRRRFYAAKHEIDAYA